MNELEKLLKVFRNNSNSVNFENASRHAEINICGSVLGIIPSDLVRSYRTTGLILLREYELLRNCPDCNEWGLHFFVSNHEIPGLLMKKCWILIRSCRFCDYQWDEEI